MELLRGARCFLLPLAGARLCTVVHDLPRCTLFLSPPSRLRISPACCRRLHIADLRRDTATHGLLAKLVVVLARVLAEDGRRCESHHMLEWSSLSHSARGVSKLSRMAIEQQLYHTFHGIPSCCHL